MIWCLQVREALSVNDCEICTFATVELAVIKTCSATAESATRTTRSPPSTMPTILPYCCVTSSRNASGFASSLKATSPDGPEQDQIRLRILKVIMQLVIFKKRDVICHILLCMLCVALLSLNCIPIWLQRRSNAYKTDCCIIIRGWIKRLPSSAQGGITCGEPCWPWFELPAKLLQGLGTSLEEALTERKDISCIACLGSDLVSSFQTAFDYSCFGPASARVEFRNLSSGL